METGKIYTQHEENKEWANNLSFYKDDIKILTGRLEEVASKNTSKDILALVERFQNQLLIQKEQIDMLNHSINLQNDLITKEIKKNEVAVDHRKIEDHSALRENMKSFEMIFKTLRLEMMDFLSKTM